MTRVLSLALIVALSAILIWQRDRAAQAHAAQRTDVANCITARLPPAERLKICAALLDKDELSPAAQAKLHFSMGLAHKDAQSFDAAIPAFERAMSLETKRIYFAERAYAHMRLGRYREALPDLHKVVDGWPEAGDFLHKSMSRNIAFAHRKLGDHDTELVALGHHLDIWPNDTKVIKQRVSALRKVRSADLPMDKAVEHLLLELKDLSQLIDLDEGRYLKHLKARQILFNRMGLIEHAMQDGASIVDARRTAEALEMPDDKDEKAADYAGTEAFITHQRQELLAMVDPAASGWDAVAHRATVQFMRGRIAAAIVDTQTLITLRPDDKKRRDELDYLIRLQRTLTEIGLALD